MGKVLLIDGNSLMHRAYHAIPSLSTREGLPTNAVFGFTNMLFKVLAEEKPDRVAVAFDKGRITFRHDTLETYKASRPVTPEELRPQFPLLKDVLQAARIPFFEVDGYEADDIIGALATQAEQKNLDVIILTGDKDTLQLVSPRVRVLITRKGISELEPYDEEKIVARYGLAPALLADLKGLAGDQSDNIPGIPGIGPKTAAEFLQRFGTLEDVLEHADELPPRARNLVRDYGAQARLCKEVATIERYVPGIDVDAVPAWPGPDYTALLNVFRRLEFRSLIKNLLREQEEIKTFTPPFKVVDGAEELRDLYREARRVGKVNLALDIVNDQPVTVGLAVGEETYILPGLHEQPAISFLKDLLEDANVAKICHDAKEIRKVGMRLGWHVANIAFDTMVAAYIVNPLSPNRNLSELALDQLNLVIPSTGLAATAARAQAVRRLYPLLNEKLRQQDQLTLYNEIELPLTGVLGAMELAGIAVDKEQLARMSGELSEHIETLAQEIYRLAGEQFNINSPKQLAYILFERLRLPARKRTKTGYSTDAAVLEELAEDHPIVGKLLAYRQLVKLKGTYADGLAAVIDATTGRLHTTFHQTVTATGRLSSAEPNLQNIPIRLELGRRIRKVFIPRNPENLLLTADYSQIELRILAHLAGDPALIAAFRENQDIHTQTAAEVFGVPLASVTPEMRSRAKAVNFGIVYGISDFGLARDIGVSRQEARRFIDRYLTRFGGVKAFIEQTIRDAREQGYVTTLFNRRRYLPELFNPNRATRAFGERAAVNTRIQGSAADIIKLAMVNLHRQLVDRQMKTQMVLQVHDELIFDVPRKEFHEVAALVKREMEGAVRLNVPLLVELKAGSNWYDVQHVNTNGR
ncbi:MAG: DNA polymerase I [Desulfotomaculales bacterium]